MFSVIVHYLCLAPMLTPEMLTNLFLTLFFFFNDTATTEIYTLSLHDALPIFGGGLGVHPVVDVDESHEDDEARSEEHTSELQSQSNLVCRLLLEKKNKTN